VGNLTFEVAGFLNVSEDHISPQEHPDFEDYLSAKLELFSQARVAVVNARTQESARVMSAASHCEKVVTFALADPDQGPIEADILGCEVVAVESGQEFSVCVGGGCQRFFIAMPGDFNVVNALAALSMAVELGVPIEFVREGLASTRVPGRMEVFSLVRGTTVIVDYAHQKLSVEALLAWVKKEFPSAPIWMVFGAGGNKGWNRREELGVLAGRCAQEIFLTEDDPGEVSVEEISLDVDRYIRATGHRGARIIPDRPVAIETAIAGAGDDAVVLVLGKGAERWQLRGTAPVAVPSDLDTVRRVLAG